MRVVPGLFISIILMSLNANSTYVVAQTLTPEDQQRLETDLQQQDAARGRAEEEGRTRLRRRRSAPRTGANTPDPFAVPPGGPCFAIKSVRVTGHEPFGALPEGYQHLIGTCATAADIAEALNRINSYYQAKGFITTWAFLPEQNIADGQLNIQIVAGRVEGYIYSDGRQADRRIRGAFPSQRGDLLNLRDLEQGLENFNAPRSASGRFQLIPGERPGGSFVQIFAQDSRRFHFDAELKNTGFETTGVAKGALNFGVDNLFGVSDQLSFGLTTTPFESRGERYSDAVSLSFTVPYRNWSFGLDAGASRYFYILQGINETFPVAGRSRFVTFFAERLVMRNQTAKVYAFSDLKLTRTKTFIDDIEIESQRRSLTIGSLGLRGEKTFPAGRLNWEAGGKFGLDAFGASVLEASIVDSNFRLIKGELSFQRPIGQTGLTYRGVASGQYSNSILPGTEQFSVGSWSNVRGFHEDNLFGDSGFYVQNTVEWMAYRGENLNIRMHAGLDYGYIEPSTLRFWSQNHLIGATIGARLDIGRTATLDLRVGHALSRPDENPPNSNPAFEFGRTVYYIGLKARF